MRAYVLIFTIMFAGCKTSAGQNADELFSNFSKEKNAEVVTLGSFLTKMAKSFVEDGKEIESIRVLSLEECSDETKKKFEKGVSNLKKDGYETLVRSNGENEDTHVMIKTKDDIIYELLVITTGNEPKMVSIKGKLKQSDLSALINKN